MLSFVRHLQKKIMGDHFGFKGILLLLLAIGLAFWTLPGPSDEGGEESLSQTKKGEDTVQKEVSSSVTLVLPNRSLSGLEQAPISVTSGTLLDDRITATLVALLRHDRFALLNPDIFIREVFVVGDKTAVVSIDSGFRKSFNGGALTELLIVTSLVNTVVESFGSEIERVTLLIDDRPSDIFATHVDIGASLTMDHSLDSAAGS